MIYFRYLIGGGTSTAVVLGGLYFLHEVIGIDPVLSSVIIYPIGIVVSFTLQKFWVFEEKSTEIVHKQFLSFLVLAGTNFLLNYLLMYIFIDILNIWYILSQIMVSGTVAVSNFIAYKTFVFKINEITHIDPKSR
jgi:putative flippase GtrA